MEYDLKVSIENRIREENKRNMEKQGVSRVQ